MKKRLVLLLVFPALAAFAAGLGWEFNVFLYLEFLGDRPGYEVEVAAGAPCYGWVGTGRPDTPQPVCFYDADNTNPGYVGSAVHGERRVK